MTNEIRMIGNVQFYKDDIASSSVTTKFGKNINTVFMKDGTKVVFSDQQITDPKKMPSVMMGRDGSINNPPKGIKFSNFGSGHVQGAPGEDYYYFENSGLTVDVQDGDGADTVKVVRGRGEKAPQIWKDADDKYIIVNKDDGIMNMNEGLWIRG